MRITTFLAAVLALGLILSLTVDAKSIKGKKKVKVAKKPAHKKQDAPVKPAVAAAEGEPAEGAPAEGAPAEGADAEEPAEDAAPEPGPPAKPGPAPPAGLPPPPVPGNPVPGDEVGSGSGAAGNGAVPIVLGGHPHAGPPVVDFNPFPAPRYCEAPCPQECSPACYEWCCFPSIQAPQPAPQAAPAPLPYGALAVPGMPGMPLPQMPEPIMATQAGYKKHKVGSKKHKINKAINAHGKKHRHNI